MNVCRRCGLPLNAEHACSPYLCRFEPRRGLVRASMNGNRVARRILWRDEVQRRAEYWSRFETVTADQIAFMMTRCPF